MSACSGLLFGIMLAVCLLGAGSADTARASGWEPARQITPPGQTVATFSSDIGPKGLTAIAWTVSMPPTRGTSYRARVFAKIRLPGKDRFGPKRFLGIAGPGYVTAAIGGRGLTVLSWPDPSNHLRVLTRSVDGTWTKAQRISAGKAHGAIIDVGVDGTTILLSSWAAEGSSRQKIQVATRNRNTGRFSPWIKASQDPGSVGFDADVVAGVNGEGTVVWAGPCPVGSAARNASYVDMSGLMVTSPKTIPNSKCVPWDLDLQIDNAGRQYFRIGGSKYMWNGVKLAIRQPGQPFPAMKFLSETGEFTDGGILAVSPGGRATVIWRVADNQSYHWTKYQYVTSRNGRFPSAVRELENIRTNRHGRRDLLEGMAALPGGKVTMLWKESRTDPDGSWRSRIGTRSWDPGTVFKRPSYQYPVAKELLAYPTLIDAASDGSRMAMWGKDDNALMRGINWIHP